MPRPRPRLRTMRQTPFDPNKRGDGRYLQHIGGNDYFGDAYGERGTPDFDRERMEADWRQWREEIIALAKITHAHCFPLWSQKEFDHAET